MEFLKWNLHTELEKQGKELTFYIPNGIMKAKVK